MKFYTKNQLRFKEEKVGDLLKITFISRKKRMKPVIKHIRLIDRTDYQLTIEINQFKENTKDIYNSMPFCPRKADFIISEDPQGNIMIDDLRRSN